MPCVSTACTCHDFCLAARRLAVGSLWYATYGNVVAGLPVAGQHPTADGLGIGSTSLGEQHHSLSQAAVGATGDDEGRRQMGA